MVTTSQTTSQRLASVPALPVAGQLSLSVSLFVNWYLVLMWHVGSKSKHREMETYETNPDFARVSFLRNTKSAALGVSGFEKRNISVPRAVSFPSSGMWGVTGETGRRREQAKY